MDIPRAWQPWTGADAKTAAGEGWELSTAEVEGKIVLRYLGAKDDALRVRDSVLAAAATGSDLHSRALLLEGAPAGSEHTLTCMCPCCESTDIRSNDLISSTQPVLTWQVVPLENGIALAGDSFGSGSVHYDTAQAVPGEDYFCGDCDATFTRPLIAGVDAVSDREKINEWNQLNALAHAPLDPRIDQLERAKALPENVISVLERAAALIGKYPIAFAQMDESDRDALQLADIIAKAAQRPAETRLGINEKTNETSLPTMAMR